MTSSERRIARIGKTPVFASAVFTALCAVGALCWQAASGLKTGDWEPYRIADLFALANIHIPRRYEPASFGPPETRLFDLQRLVDWLLDTPVVFPLLIATVLISVFYLWLWRIEDARPGGASEAGSRRG